MHVGVWLYDKVIWQMILVSTEITNNGTEVLGHQYNCYTLLEYTKHRNTQVLTNWNIQNIVIHKCSPTHIVFTMTERMLFPMRNERERRYIG